VLDTLPRRDEGKVGTVTLDAGNEVEIRQHRRAQADKGLQTQGVQSGLAVSAISGNLRRRRSTLRVASLSIIDVPAGSVWLIGDSIFDQRIRLGANAERGPAGGG
jgi:hypothetical protein